MTTATTEPAEITVFVADFRERGRYAYNVVVRQGPIEARAQLVQTYTRPDGILYEVRSDLTNHGRRGGRLGPRQKEAAAPLRAQALERLGAELRQGWAVDVIYGRSVWRQVEPAA